MPVAFVALASSKLLFLSPLKARRRVVVRLSLQAVEKLIRRESNGRKTKVSLLSLSLSVSAILPLHAFTVLALAEGSCFRVDVPVGCAAAACSVLPLTVMAAEGSGFAAVAFFFSFSNRARMNSGLSPQPKEGDPWRHRCPCFAPCLLPLKVGLTHWPAGP